DELDIVKMMLADFDALCVSYDLVVRIKAGGEDPRVDVCHDDPKDQSAVAAFDITDHFRPAHLANIDAREERMRFTDCAFAQQGRNNRDLILLGKFQQRFYKTITLDFVPDPYHWPATFLKDGNRFCQGFFKSFWIAFHVRKKGVLYMS